MTDAADPLTTKLHATADAMVWAEEFCRLFEVTRRSDGDTADIGLMIGWFANAMEIAIEHRPTKDPGPAFWSVVNDICTQARRYWVDRPDDKAVEIQLDRADVTELRAALERAT